MKTNHYLSLNSCGLHRLSYSEWGTPNAQPLICVHGLSRNSRDFDALAKHLSNQGAWVICPDIAGRGLSDWLADPNDYCLQQYLHDMLALIARLNVTQVDWLGTSMGGIIGLMLSSQSHTPIKRLILNDISPDLSNEGIKRLQQYLPRTETLFASLDLAERYFRQTLSSFGPLSAMQWRHLTKCSIKPTSNGAYTLRVDPKIFLPDVNANDQHALWNAWQRVRCPTLVIRGETSDILSLETVNKMRSHHRRLTTLEIPEVGHAPFLSSPFELDYLSQWLSTNGGSHAC